jgi:hypothetical protein
MVNLFGGFMQSTSGMNNIQKEILKVKSISKAFLNVKALNNMVQEKQQRCG